MLIDPYRHQSDPDFFNTFMLLHCEDGQLYERTGFPVVTIVGAGAVSSVTSMFGTQSFRNPGTTASGTNFVRVEGSLTDFVFPGQFTFEGWFNVLSYGDQYNNFFANNINFPAAGFIQLAVTSAGVLFWNSSAGSVGSAVGVYTPYLNSWAHVAISRDAANAVRLFLHGTQVATASWSGTVGGDSGGVSSFDVCRGHASDNADLDCYFEEIRVTKACRYTASFTPPTAPFPPFP